MESKGQLSSVLIFEYAFKVLEKEMQKGTQSLATSEKIEAFIRSLPSQDPDSAIENLRNTVPLIRENDKLMASQSIPAIVVLSFAIEVAIKALITQTKSTRVDKHEHEKLIRNLPEILKERVQKRVMADLQIGDEAYESLLKVNESGFVNWRYFYENHQNANLGFLKSLFSSLKQELNFR